MSGRFVPTSLESRGVCRHLRHLLLFSYFFQYQFFFFSFVERPRRAFFFFFLIFFSFFLSVSAFSPFFLRFRIIPVLSTVRVRFGSCSELYTAVVRICLFVLFIYLLIFFSSEL